MSQTTLEQMTLLIFLLPVAGWLFSALVPRKIFKSIDVFATTIMGFCLLLSLCVFTQSWQSAGNLLIDLNFAWLPTVDGKSLNCGLMLDRLTAVMLVVVTGVSFLVHLFSTKYMAGDVRYERYYCCLLLLCRLRGDAPRGGRPWSLHRVVGLARTVVRRWSNRRSGTPSGRTG